MYTSFNFDTKIEECVLIGGRMFLQSKGSTVRQLNTAALNKTSFSMFWQLMLWRILLNNFSIDTDRQKNVEQMD